MRTRIALALIGCGWIAGNRLRQISSDDRVEVVQLIDPSAEACAAMRKYASTAVTGTALEAVDPQRVDGAVISTPSALHAQQAVALLERGIPVFVQKPMGVTADEVDRVLDCAASRGLSVDTDFCHRDLRCAGAVRRDLGSGAVGRPYYVEARFHNAYRPGAGWSMERRSAGGGALLDLGIHMIDLVCWLMGERAMLDAVDLRTSGRYAADDDLEDFARLDLTLGDSIGARVVSAWNASVGNDARIELEIHCSGGSLVMANRGGSFFHFDAWRHHGTSTELIATDDNDLWQGEPLKRWLSMLAVGRGYQEPPGLRHTTALIDEAYRAAGLVHPWVDPASHRDQWSPRRTATERLAGSFESGMRKGSELP